MRESFFACERSASSSFGILSDTGNENNLMSVKLYVGNLSFNTSTKDLRDLFSSVGSVNSCSIIEDRDSGRSRGFGFVVMASKAESENAIAQLDGREIDGRELSVALAKPSVPRQDEGRGEYKGGSYLGYAGA